MDRVQSYKAYLSIALTCIFLIVLIAACAQRPEPQELLPQSVFLTLSIKMKNVIGDNDLCRFILGNSSNTDTYSVDQVIPGTKTYQTPRGNEITDGLATIGINLKQVDDLTAFVGQVSSSTEYEGIIIRGDYNAKHKIGHLIQKGWKINHYLKKTYYCSTYSDECIIALAQNVLLSGSTLTIHEILDVINGKEKALVRHPIYKKLASELRENNDPINICVIMPQEVLDSAGAAVDIGSSVVGVGANLIAPGMESMINFAGSITKGLLFRGAVMSVDHSGGKFPVKVAILMLNEKAASIASDTFSLGKKLASLLPKDLMGTEDNPFQDMDVSRSGQVLKIDMVMSRKQFLSW